MSVRTGVHQRLVFLSPLSSANISSRPGASPKTPVICTGLFSSKHGHASRGFSRVAPVISQALWHPEGQVWEQKAVFSLVIKLH